MKQSTKLKRKVGKATGIPLTKSGRANKFGGLKWIFIIGIVAYIYFTSQQ